MYNEEEYFTYTNKQKLKAQQMDMIKSTLDGSPAYDKDAVYLVDFSKMTSLEDLITVLASIGFSFSPMHTQFDNIKHLLALDKPIQIGNTKSVQEAQSQKLELPKLKTLK